MRAVSHSRLNLQYALAADVGERWRSRARAARASRAFGRQKLRYPKILAGFGRATLARAARHPYIGRHRVSAERLGLAAINAPD